MRYEDSSHTGSGQVDARNDADHLAARDYGPATGNVISGTGTITGSAGLDMVDSGAGKITAIDGASGSDSSFSAGKLSVHGQYGTLSIDARGNYSYERDPGSSAGVSDVFHYTLANKAGATDIARLVINIGDLPKLATEGTRVVPGADGVVTLPAGVALSDIHIVGRDLVVTLPDGSTMIIVDGAVFVPQLVLDGVEVPATNLAALLIGSEPRPAAGDFGSDQQSSGGNFAVPVSPLDPGVPLGDLLPPTELGYTPPEFHEPGQFITQNDAPLIVSSAIAVSEEGLPNGLPDTNPGPPQDTTNLSVVSGTVAVSDPNGDPLTVGLGAPPAGLTSGGVALTWVVSPDGHLLTGSAGGNTVVTISITDAGAYTVTLLRPIDHPAGAGENTTSIVVPVTVSDGALAAVGSITVTFEDDSPNASAAAAASGITVDETSAAIPGFPLTATSVGAIVTLSGAFGADGPAASGSTVYGLSLTGGVGSLASGLFTSNGHQAITLVQTNSTTITGTFGASQTAFVLVINPNGTVTYTQSVALDHVTDGSSADALNDTSTPITLAGLVNATIALTDFDGDSATGSVAIGDRIRVFDDGPSVSLASSAVEPVLTVDETNLGANASASFAGLFTGTAGADGLASKTYALAVTAGPSGLVDVATNEAINLVLSGTTVEGRTAGTNQLVFTVVVDANGLVTLDQIRAIKHSPDTGPDQPATLSADNLVRLVATIVDKDGDSASASVDIGQNLVFKDDAPSIIRTETTEPTLSVDETVLGTNASASFAGLFSTAYGADDAGTTVYSLSVGAGASGLIDTASGLAVVLSVNGSGQVEGRAGAGGAIVFVVSVDSAGVVTLDQQRAVVHTTSSNLDTSEGAGLALDSLIALKVTVTDKDGDSATASVNIGSNLTFLDDGPSASVTSITEPTLSVDETVLGTNASASFAGLFSTAYGADNAGTTVYGLNVVAGPSGLTDTATGQAVILSLVGGVVEGRTAISGDLVFTVSVNSATGLVTLDQIRAVVHTTSSNPDTSEGAGLALDSLIAVAESPSLSVTVTFNAIKLSSARPAPSLVSRLDEVV